MADSYFEGHFVIMSVAVTRARVVELARDDGNDAVAERRRYGSGVNDFEGRAVLSRVVLAADHEAHGV